MRLATFRNVIERLLLPRKSMKKLWRVTCAYTPRPPKNAYTSADIGGTQTWEWLVEYPTSYGAIDAMKKRFHLYGIEDCFLWSVRAEEVQIVKAAAA